MLLFLLSAMGLVMAAAQSPNPIPYSGFGHGIGHDPIFAQTSSASYLEKQYSVLYNLLQILGYSETCVSNALETCSADTGQAQHPSLIQNVREVLKEVSLLVKESESRPRHCKDLLDSGDSGNGLRLVYPYPGEPHRRVTVYCDHTVDGGGWTVFQRRTNTSTRQDFYRTWIEYMLGFGDLEGEFWLGLDHLHILTSTTLQQLRIDLEDYEEEERWAQYDFFNVGPNESNYRLKVGRFSGNVEDGMLTHNGSSFSTHDHDNDSYSENCAERFHGAWWYKKCHTANLNGYQHEGNHSTYGDGINWYHWKGDYYSLKRTSMMIRPAF